MSQPSFDFERADPDWEAAPHDEAGNPTYSVAELAEVINQKLRSAFFDGVWVRGEIDGFRRSGPHVYFTLVEHTDDGKAVLNVSLFAPMLRRLTPVLKKNRLDLANGMKVRIFGELDFYAPTGRLGLRMAGIDPRFTLGELSQARDQVIRKLVASGLIDANKRHQFPLVPLTIGVVTSVGTAAWHDFHDEIERSGFGFRLAVCDTRVQGDGAEHSLAAAIRTLARWADSDGPLDCIVVIRGGGARNELATFDAEPIALAIATSPVPVVTGLGHEVDRSVADEVAHTAVKTPTACAGLLVELVTTFRNGAETRWESVIVVADRRVAAAHDRLAERAQRIARHTRTAIARADERLVGRSDRLVQGVSRVLAGAERDLGTATATISRQPVQLLAAQERHLEHLAARMSLLDPVNLLRRGWAISRDERGNIVRSVNDVTAGSLLITQVADGAITSRIEGTTP
jgi:exodeoxyribonuclease VII large subunit